jgi:hypothetical protein
MEENKKCCESGACEKCADKKEGTCCSGMCLGKCPMLKILIPILLIAAAFYVGTLVGCNDDFRGRGNGQRYIEEGFGPKLNTNSSTDVVTPDISVEITEEGIKQ